MKVKYLSAFELMERWHTTERIAIKAAVEAGLPTMQKGRMVKPTRPWRDWSARKTDERQWQPSEFGTLTRQIASEDFDSVEFECLVFDIDAVEHFETCRVEQRTSETPKERILKLAKSRELTSAHFTPGAVPEIDEIAQNVSHDTLRKYVSDEKLLKPSKRGRPSKRYK